VCGEGSREMIDEEEGEEFLRMDWEPSSPMKRKRGETVQENNSLGLNMLPIQNCSNIRFS